MENRFTAFAPRHAKQIALLLSIVLITGMFSGCTTLIDGLFSNFLDERPTAESTHTDVKEITDALSAALERGDTKVTMDVVADEAEIKNITENMSAFWGSPDTYIILRDFGEIKLTDDENATAVGVKRVEFNLALSNNYYVYRAWKDEAFSIPEGKEEAQAVYDSLKTVIPEIFGGNLDASGTAILSAYDSTLAVHDWLVANIVYDDSIKQTGTENGSYGALIHKKTMCQGYAESLQLILECATDVQVKMQVGEGNSGDGNWIGHAWNLVYMNDAWYQVDATFDDPVGNPDRAVNHFYFGQDDETMTFDHKWDSAYWNPTDGENFLWYRKNGRYVESKKAFETAVKKILSGKTPKHVEIATKGFTLSDADLQFIFNANPKINTLYQNQTRVNDVNVVGLEITYRSAS
jgi:hypothetical protein